jgi:1-aminocyclopropane-1-carboxylate deaminase
MLLVVNWPIKTKLQTHNLLYILLQIPSPLEKLHLPYIEEKEVSVYIKRDDLIHPIISGNKWRKLKHTLNFCLSNDTKGILTLGGAHSNHLIATAYIGNHNNLKTVGIIRGEEPNHLSPTLIQCKDLGMKLHFISRLDYRKIEKLRSAFQLEYPNYHWVPEGGADELGILGCQEIIKEISIDFDFITVDCGTAATLAGITRALLPHQKAIGIAVLKGEDTLTKQVHTFNQNNLFQKNFEINFNYHFGGYAHYSAELVGFMQWFHAQTGIKTDPIYTAKQFYGVMDLIKQDYFPKGSTIVMVHTGGLQGIIGYEKRYGITIY